ncbi:MAG TPA: NADH-quinone oxidoreductase subunit C [Planctomycetaceae bacterium]|nr:NADH-quinone oxidoreductase subunit C [Planctomycetaceae bacterium]
MDAQGILERLRARFGPSITGSNLDAIDPWIEVAADELAEVCRFLRDDPELQFNYLNCITGVDYLQTDPKRAAKTPWQPHLEVIYHLTSLVHRHRLVLKVILPRWKEGVEGQLPEVPSVSGVWSTADWHEREVYDLCGVRFVGHPDLRRILCPEDWQGHPLRKDYVVPEEYHGIRVR